MWAGDAFRERFGLSYPIVQAPMAAISLADLVAAVSEAGGLGSLGSATLSAEQIGEEVRKIRARTQRPFALNFFLHAPPRLDEARLAQLTQRLAGYRAELGVHDEPVFKVPPPFDAAMLECVLALKPAAVSFHFGVPDRAVLDALKRAGIYVMASATHVKEAQLLEQAGLDAIVAQGVEAGGHRGTFAVPYAQGELGLLSLLPQVVDSVRVPVIAAGGIADGRGIAAALTLGAAAVQLGTLFLATPEALIDPIYRRTLFEPRAAETRVTKLWTGRPARAIVTRYLDEMRAYEDEMLEFPLQRVLSLQLDRSALAKDSPEFHAMWAGQNASRLRALPAAQLLEALAAETVEAMRAGQSRVGA